MEEEEWSEELFPGIFVVGHADDTGGNQGIIIDKDGKHYILMTEGYDYGSWLGLRLELTGEERDQALNWTKENYGTYEFTKWLEKLWKSKKENEGE